MPDDVAKQRMDGLKGSMSNMAAMRSRRSHIFTDSCVFHSAKVLSPCVFGTNEVDGTEGLSSSREEEAEEEEEEEEEEGGGVGDVFG